MGTVAKALSLLGHFTRTRSEIGLSDMARLSGLNKATVYRLLGELQAGGFVEQVGSGRGYRLGPVYLRLAALREAAVPMREAAADVLRALSAATGETAHCSLREGDALRVLAYTYDQQHGTRVTMEDADMLELHCTSSGVAVLAWSAPELADRVLAGPLVARTSKTLTDPAAIAAQCTLARARGVAESVSGFEMDVHSHASPLFDAHQSCIGAIAVAAPVARMTEGLKMRIRAALPRAARDLTRRLGGFCPEAFTTLIPAEAAE